MTLQIKTAQPAFSSFPLLLFLLDNNVKLYEKIYARIFRGNMALRYDNLEKAEKEARKKHMAAWGEWMSELMKAEHLEVGYPLESNGKRIDPDRSHDYHFPDTQRVVLLS